MIETYERTGQLAVHGADLLSRFDAIDFTARAGEPTVDWLVEVLVQIERWGTREGVATLLEPKDDADWTPLDTSMRFDAIELTRVRECRLVFSCYNELRPGGLYRLFLAGAVVASPTFTIVAQVRPHAITPRHRVAPRLRGRRR